MFRKLAGALTIGAALFCCAAPASAVTVNYVLTFTPTGGTATGGTGLLVLNEFPGVLTNIGINGNDHDGIGADFVSLTATVNGTNFTFTNLNNVFFLGENNGVWNNISAQSDVASGSGGHTFRLGTGGLTYNLQDINVTQIGNGIITVGAPQIQQGGNAGATPLPAALPLFAGGLGVIGLVARRNRRKTA